ncbi:hypothetical protein Back11_03450 [Paenibacillus baekrokdamisoli]|uniref:Uncharacterized protein n=1 Tax=Paenibacillus baekrokdamisoli TaxID=1712516 RepID=A0A3G9IJB7_9BACL|nr:hypothetical protein [Paenibacillus baekrokdamisoli]BBH19000.1 hypothetical protein Back11_03450 [Paenibacillus baekrokdamisoli]
MNIASREKYKKLKLRNRFGAFIKDLILHVFPLIVNLNHVLYQEMIDISSYLFPRIDLKQTKDFHLALTPVTTQNCGQGKPPDLEAYFCLGIRENYERSIHK